MPLLCMARAVALIRDSETLQPYAFQSLKPICGVSASPLPKACAGAAAVSAITGTDVKATAAAMAMLLTRLPRSRRGLEVLGSMFDLLWSRWVMRAATGPWWASARAAHGTADDQEDFVNVNMR